MKNLTIITLLVFFAGCSFAGSNNGTTQANYAFKSMDGEVSFEVERVSSEVKMHILIKDLSQLHHILIERSGDGGISFGQCKYISCDEENAKDGYLLKTDKYPLPASKDCYYRIKTVTKDGVTRAYPAVTLSSVSK